MITVWQVSDGKPLWSKIVSGRVTSLDYSHDGKLIAAGVGLGSEADPFSNERKPCVVTFLNAGNGEVVSEWKGPNGKINTIGFSLDDSEAIVVDETKTVTAWNLKNSEKSKQFAADAHNRQIQSASLSADSASWQPTGCLKVCSSSGMSKRVVESAKLKSEVEKAILSLYHRMANC